MKRVCETLPAYLLLVILAIPASVFAIVADVPDVDLLKKAKREIAPRLYETNSVSDRFLRGVSDENRQFIKNIKNEFKNQRANYNSKSDKVKSVIRRENKPIKPKDIANPSEMGKKLNEVNKAVRILNVRSDKLKEKAIRAVSDDVDKIIRSVRREVKKADSDIKVFPSVVDGTGDFAITKKRKRNINYIEEKLNRKKEEIKEYINIVVDSSAKGESDTKAIDTVLFSSMEEVENIIFKETGVKADLSINKRRVVKEIKKDVENFQKQISALNSRGGLDLYKDSDNDGVSDYDEIYIYFSDPNNAYTSGSSLTDGERIMFGFDVHSTSTERIPVESPKEAGEVSKELFEVNEIKRIGEDELVFKGKALPNSFVTLYIFSTPIVVTVKASEDGRWEYMLKTQLEDGSHSLYVASVNNSGKILAKSPEVPFIKTAEAVEFTPLEVTITEPSPIDTLKGNIFAVSILLLALFGIIVTLTIGSWRSRLFGA